MQNNRKYRIRFQQRAPFKGGNPRDWRNWRKFSFVGKLFNSHDEAEEYFKAHHFKNMTGRKLSASIECVWVKA